MKISKVSAVAMFVTLGFKIATTWPNDKLVEKLGELHKHIDPATELPDAEQQKLLVEVMATGKAGGKFDLEDDAPAAATPAPAGKGKGKGKGKGAAAAPAATDTPAAAAPAGKTPEQIAADKAAKEKETADAKAAKAKEKADAKVAADKAKADKKAADAKAKADAKAAEKAKKKTAKHVCGNLLAQGGLVSTDAMEAEYMKITGSDSPTDAKASLASAIHVIKGWLEVKDPAEYARLFTAAAPAPAPAK